MALDDAAENQFGGGERGVHQKTDERHQPVIQHRLDAERVGGMDIDDRTQFVRLLPQRREHIVRQCHVVDVAEHHRARKAEILHRAFELGYRCRRIVERQGGERREAATFVPHYRGKCIVDLPRERDARCRRLHVHARSGERDQLRIDAVLDQHLFAVIDVAMTRDQDVVVPRVMDTRISRVVIGHLDCGF